MKHKSVRYLFNNAGYLDRSTFGEFSEIEYDMTMDTNVKGPLFLANVLEFAENAKIMNIGSQSVNAAYKPYLFYCISKAALLMVNKVLNE